MPSWVRRMAAPRPEKPLPTMTIPVWRLVPDVGVSDGAEVVAVMASTVAPC
ncbi:hypothetical protein GCM10027047_11850 [Rhodococcus aerolatus]